MSEAIDKILITAGYLVVGMLVYILSYGNIVWSDEWVIVVMALWPFFLIYWFAYWFLLLCLAIWAASFGIMAYVFGWDWVKDKLRI